MSKLEEFQKMEAHELIDQARFYGFSLCVVSSGKELRIRPNPPPTGERRWLCDELQARRPEVNKILNTTLTAQKFKISLRGKVLGIHFFAKPTRVEGVWADIGDGYGTDPELMAEAIQPQRGRW